MALIRQFSRLTKEHQRVHGPVDCGYSVFEQVDTRYVQLDTYGSAGRQIPGKTSQSIQFDARSAHQLVRILDREFGAPTND
jgi:hypothetical protein